MTNPAGNVLVTGASKGIGRAIAVELSRRGHPVVATARNPRSLDDLDVAGRVALDVTDGASVAAAVAEAGPVRTLVSNAGVIFYAAVEASPLDEVRRLFETNTFGALRVAQAVLPGMRSAGRGRVLLVSSVVAHLVAPGGAAYAATKAALDSLAEGMATEVAPFGIDVGLLEPGPVSSGALDDVLRHTLPDDPYASLWEGPGRPREAFITPEEVASAVADAVEADRVPLRQPVGAWAADVLARRQVADDSVPFA